MPMFTIDAHLDLATNAIHYNRDITWSINKIRNRELVLGLADAPDRGHGTVSLPALREGNIGLVVATIIARFSYGTTKSTRLTGWHSPEQAYAYAQAQLTWYQLMEDQGQMLQIATKSQLQSHVKLWQNNSIDNSKKPVGYILSLEGADSIIDPKYLEKYYENGLRAIGPAHYGSGRYAAGTNADGTGFTKRGKELLKLMQQMGMVLDVTHLTDKGFYEAIDSYQGPIWASHQNCRALVPHERQFSDEQLNLLIARGAVIGGALDAWMLAPNFQPGGADKPIDFGVNLEKLVDHFDHICQLAGNCQHIGFGTDLDGLFGTEQSPHDLDTIADIAQYENILARRGYNNADIENIFHKNWLRIMAEGLPDS